MGSKRVASITLLLFFNFFIFSIVSGHDPDTPSPPSQLSHIELPPPPHFKRSRRQPRVLKSPPPLVTSPPKSPLSPPTISPPLLPPTSPPFPPPPTSPPPVSPPLSPPVSPPLSPPVSPPLSPPVSPPLSPPVSPPLSPPVSPPLSPPVSLPPPPPNCSNLGACINFLNPFHFPKFPAIINCCSILHAVRNQAGECLCASVKARFPQWSDSTLTYRTGLLLIGCGLGSPSYRCN